VEALRITELDSYYKEIIENVNLKTERPSFMRKMVCFLFQEIDILIFYNKSSCLPRKLFELYIIYGLMRC